MPQRTALQMIEEARQYMRGWYPSDESIINGFPGDPGLGGPVVSLLTMLNIEVSRINEETEFSRQYVNMTLAANASEVDIPSDWYTIYSVTINGLPLRKTTVESLDRRHGDWTLQTAGQPEMYFMNGTKSIVFDRPASTSTTTPVRVLALIETAELEEEADTIEYYPGILGWLPAVCLALSIAEMDSGNPLAQSRVTFLTARRQEGITKMKEFLQKRAIVDEDAPSPLGGRPNA